MQPCIAISNSPHGKKKDELTLFVNISPFRTFYKYERDKYVYNSNKSIIKSAQYGK